ncbi:MAG: ATP-binding cassette domain-containing protein [Polyangiaceae bacterium]
MRPENTLSVKVKFARAAFTLDVDLEVPPGITILFGPSGSGKSTTLALIAGLERPAKGRVALGDDAWFDDEKKIDRPVHARGVAFVFQSLALFPHMTALANVEYGMDRALGRNMRAQRAKEMLERFRVGHLALRRPQTFSGGEAQRVALARALGMFPRVVLLDEPFSAMDRELRAALVADVRASALALKIPMLHVTHHRQEARMLADRIVMMDAGRIVAVGAVRDLLPEEKAADAAQ